MAKKIHNSLTKVFSHSTEIKKYLRKVKNHPYFPAYYLYDTLMGLPKAKRYSDEHLFTLYATLAAWGMNSRGARLAEFGIFKKSILVHREKIEQLSILKLQNVKNHSEISDNIRFLFDKLKLVEKGKRKLVTFSKTMHYLAPNLLMPVDGQKILMFFYNNANIPKEDEKQLAIYFNIFDEYTSFYEKRKDVLQSYKENKIAWKRTIPKIIDNLIIAKSSQ